MNEGATRRMAPYAAGAASHNKPWWPRHAQIECAMLSRGGTALVMGHWVEVSRVVCGRLGVVCELARPLGRALELSDRTLQNRSSLLCDGVKWCEMNCSQLHVE